MIYENNGKFYDDIKADGTIATTPSTAFIGKSGEFTVIAKKLGYGFTLIHKWFDENISNGGYVNIEWLKDVGITHRGTRDEGQMIPVQKLHMYRLNTTNWSFLSFGGEDGNDIQLDYGPFIMDKQGPYIECDGWIKVRLLNRHIQGTTIDQYNYINKDGKFLLKNHVKYAESFCNGTAIITDNQNHSSIIRKDGSILYTEQQRSSIFNFYDNEITYSIAWDSSDITFIDKNGKQLASYTLVTTPYMSAAPSLSINDKKVPRMLLVKDDLDNYSVIDLKHCTKLPLSSKTNKDAYFEFQKIQYDSAKKIPGSVPFEKELNRKIICAFTCEGKDTFATNHENAVDYDEDFFYYQCKTEGSRPSFKNTSFVWLRDHFAENSEFPDNLVRAIEDTPDDVKYILLSATKNTMKALRNEGIEYELVVPEPEDGMLPEWYKERYAQKFEYSPRFDGASDDESIKEECFANEENEYERVLKIAERGEEVRCMKVIYTKEDEYLSTIENQL